MSARRPSDASVDRARFALRSGDRMVEEYLAGRERISSRGQHAGNHNYVNQIVSFGRPLEDGRAVNGMARQASPSRSVSPWEQWKRWLRWFGTLVLVVIALVQLFFRCLPTAPTAHPFRQSTRDAWQKEFHDIDGILHFGGGTIPIAPNRLADGAAILGAFERQIQDSSFPQKGRLWHHLHEGQIRYRRATASHDCLHHALANYNTSWSCHLLRLVEDIDRATAATRGSNLPSAKNAFYGLFYPPWVHRSDAEIGQRVLDYATHQQQAFEEIQALAAEYAGDIERWQRNVVELSDALGAALHSHVGKKETDAKGFFPVSSKKQVDEHIEQIRDLDMLVRDIKCLAEATYHENEATITDMEAILERSQAYLDGCERGTRCQALRVGMTVLNGQAQNVGRSGTTRSSDRIGMRTTIA
ncbi:MAG: hypothetical protein Q9170_003141 [Blastenia crenularia]